MVREKNTVGTSFDLCLSIANGYLFELIDGSMNLIRLKQCVYKKLLDAKDIITESPGTKDLAIDSSIITELFFSKSILL